MSERIPMDSAELGPRDQRPGAVMQAWWGADDEQPARIEHLVFNGRRWIKLCAEEITRRDLDRGYMPTAPWGNR